MTSLISRLRPTAAVCLLGAAAVLSGCGSAAAPAHHPRKAPSSSPSPRHAAGPGAAAGGSRYVDASRSEGVTVVRPTDRLPAHETRLVNLMAGTLPVGRPRKATVGEIDVGAGLPAVGVTVRAAHADGRCGTPFLAVPGHGYRVRCTLTARRPGRVDVTLAEHDARTGATGSRYTAHARARRPGVAAPR